MEQLEYIKENLLVWLNEKRCKRCICKIKKSSISLAGMMHIYDFVMHRLPNLPEKVQIEEYGTYFRENFKTMGFSSIIGMVSLLFPEGKSIFFKSLISSEMLEKSLMAWVVVGDWHTCFAAMIENCPHKAKFVNELVTLEKLIISNSIVAGFKDADYWYSDEVNPHLVITERELKKCLEVQEDNSLDLDSGNIIEDVANESCLQSTDNQTVQQAYGAVQDEKKSVRKQKSAGKIKTSEKFSHIKSLSDFIIASDPKQVEKYMLAIENAPKTFLYGGISLVAMVVALEELHVIRPIFDRKFFWDLLPDSCKEIITYGTFTRNYNKMSPKRSVPQNEVLKVHLDEIEKYSNYFQEI